MLYAETSLDSRVGMRIVGSLSHADGVEHSRRFATALERVLVVGQEGRASERVRVLVIDRFAERAVQ